MISSIRHVIEHFTGHVQSVEKDTFWIRYCDIAGNEEQAEAITDKILIDVEKEYLAIGMYFDWVFYSDSTYEFWFCKDVWTQEEIDRAREEAEELIKYFKWKEPDLTNT